MLYDVAIELSDLHVYGVVLWELLDLCEAVGLDECAVLEVDDVVAGFAAVHAGAMENIILGEVHL